MRTIRSPRTRLAAACLGAGLLLTGVGAAPALADTVDPVTAATAGPGAELGGAVSTRPAALGAPRGSFGAVHGTTLDFVARWDAAWNDVVITVTVPSNVSDVSKDVPVPVEYDAELGRGTVDLQQTRPMLGEAATGPVVYRMQVDGRTVALFGLQADADPADAQIAPTTDNGGASVLDFAQLPVDTTTTLLTTAERPYALVGPLKAEGATARLVTGPQHGTLVPVDTTSFGMRADNLPVADSSFVYVAQQGFTGRDSVTFSYTDGTAVKQETVRISVGDPRVARFGDSLPADGSRLRSVVDAAAAKARAAAPSASTPSTTPTASPSTSAAPSASTPSASAPAPSTSAAPSASTPSAAAPSASTPAASQPAAEHEKPGAVQTGDGAAWWLAGFALVGGGALLAVRRAFLRA